MWHLVVDNKISYNFSNFLLIILVFISGFSCEDPKLGKVKYFSAIFRHGDRTPTKFYKNDPYQKLSLWPEGIGELTNIGKQQGYELGIWLRERYEDLIANMYPRFYRPDMVYAQSTDVNRVLMTCECVLAGMFPPAGPQVWNESVPWQPIPVHTVPADKDNIYTGYAKCPAYDEELKQVLESDQMKALNEKYAEIYNVLRLNTGEEHIPHDLRYITSIYSILYVEDLKNLSLPEWTHKIFPHPISEAASQSFTLETTTKTMARFKAGLILKMIIDEMNARSKGQGRSVHLFAGHEHTIASVMNALDIFYFHNPPYTACLMIELRETKAKEHVVTIFYRTDPKEEPRVLKLPGCTHPCPLAKFTFLTKPLAITPEEWTHDCFSSAPSISPHFMFFSLFYIIL